MESESRKGMESEQMMLKEDVSPLLEAIQRMSSISDGMRSALGSSFSELERVLPSQFDVDSVNSEQDALMRKFGLDALEQGYQDIPNKDDFYQQLDDIMIREQNGDIRGFNDGLKRLGQMIDGAVVSAEVMPDFLMAEVVSDYIPFDTARGMKKPELQVYMSKIWSRIGDELAEQ
jgi:hypothetical protein